MTQPININQFYDHRLLTVGFGIMLANTPPDKSYLIKKYFLFDYLNVLKFSHKKYESKNYSFFYGIN